MSEAFVTVNEFRRKLEQYLLHAEHPLVISHRGMPMGYFLPARIWHERGKVEMFRKSLATMFDMSGCGEAEVERAIERFAAANAGVLRERLQRHR
ncbi:hypothetical protein [Luteimonas huabeiensis]|uniref:hypothetical protein n=1 Tax=Luteimonas huabeiensis TaxID=1244513 RepID=UPI0004657C86|nr:hypothetical protein [Luteimonas huabeiensis]